MTLVLKLCNAKSSSSHYVLAIVSLCITFCHLSSHLVCVKKKKKERKKEIEGKSLLSLTAPVFQFPWKHINP